MSLIVALIVAIIFVVYVAMRTRRALVDRRIQETEVPA
jgi:hypothetical protein